MVIRSNNQSLFCSSGDSFSNQEISGSLIQLNRIQDYSLDMTIPYFGVNNLENNSFYQSVSRPTATLGLNYSISNLSNESAFGFNFGTGQSFFSNLNTEKNIYVKFVPLGYDVIGYLGQGYTLGFGNGVITSYSMSATVGSELKANTNFEFLEVQSYTGSSGQNVPTFDHNTQSFESGLFNIPIILSDYNTGISGQNISIIGNKDLVLSFSTGNCIGIDITGQNSCYIQNFNLAVNFNRSYINELGKKYPSSRPILYPIELEFQCEAVLNESWNKDSLSDYFCSNRKYNINLLAKKYINCTNHYNIFNLYINGLILDKQTFNASYVGPNTVNLGFKTIISNNFDLNNNIWID